MSTQNNEQIQLLREILKWIRFAGMKEVREVLNTVLDTNPKKLAYQLSDGNKGTEEIGKATGINRKATISDYWKSWLTWGLGENVPVQRGGRFKRAFDLKDFGLLPSTESEESSEKEESTSQDKPAGGQLECLKNLRERHFTKF